MSTISPILLTDSARDEIKRALEERGASESAHLRVGIYPGGCSGFQYNLDVEEEVAEDDFVFIANGIPLVVDPFSLPYLEGVTLDYVSSFQGSGFVFNNPNASGGCGCGSSFTP